MGWQGYEIFENCDIKGKIKKKVIVEEGLKKQLINNIDEISEEFLENINSEDLVKDTELNKEELQTEIENINSVDIISIARKEKDFFSEGYFLEQVEDYYFEKLEDIIYKFTLFINEDEIEEIIEENNLTECDKNTYNICYFEKELGLLNISFDKKLQCKGFSEAYNKDVYGSDCIDDAPDIFKVDESPYYMFSHESTIFSDFEYGAYILNVRVPEGSEDEIEYAEYRDVFGPARLKECLIKLSDEKTIIFLKDYKGDVNLQLNYEDITERLEELPLKKVKNLQKEYLSLNIFIDFLIENYKELNIDINSKELKNLKKIK